MEHFHFVRPWWFIALLPLLGLLVRWSMNVRRQNQWRDQVDEALLPHLLVGQTLKASRWPVALLSVLWLLAVTALAGPVWEKQPAPVFRGLQERVLIVDLSLSMNARDVKPSRLERIKQKLHDILDQTTDSQTALIVFSAVPYVVSPLTDDVQTIRAMLPSLSTDIVPVQGSRTSLALDKALDLLTQSKSKAGSVWLLTDSTPDTDATEAARQLAVAGHRLHVIGVGSDEGAPIPAGRGGFVKDASDNIVIAKLGIDPLRELAGAGGGVFSRTSNTDTDIERLLSADSIPTSNEVSTLERQAEVWLERGPFIVLLLLPAVALFFRRGVL